jgi:hypothetical protein
MGVVVGADQVLIGESDAGEKPELAGPLIVVARQSDRCREDAEHDCGGGVALAIPAPQSREKLATLLWGSHFETQAQQNLRQALYRPRQTLGQDALIGNGGEISLAPGVIDCDAARLQALIREGSQASLG